MGNEMGNSNTSGLQEEENSTTQVQEKSLQEASHANGGLAENHIVPVSEGKYYHEKENGFDSHVPNGLVADPHRANQKSNGQEEKETELHSSTETPKNVKVKSNSEAGGESREIQPNSLSNYLKDYQKPLGNEDGAEGENHIVPVAEDNNDYQEKETNSLPSDIPKEAEVPHIVNQISHESEISEVQSPGESPISELESTNAALPTGTVRSLRPTCVPAQRVGLAVKLPSAFALEGQSPSSPRKPPTETSDIQLTSPFKHLKDHEKPKYSTLEENLLQITDHQLEKKNSINEEERETKNTTSESTSTSHDPEPQNFEDSKFGQPELIKTHADPSIHDRSRSSPRIEDTLLSNLNCTSEENDHPVDAKILKDMDENIISGSTVDLEMNKDDFTVKEMPSEELSWVKKWETKDEDEVVNDLGEKPITTSDFQNGVSVECNRELSTGISPVTPVDKSLNPQVSESIDKCFVIAAMEKESEYGEGKSIDCPTQSEDSDKELKTDDANLSQSELLVLGSQGGNDQKTIADLTCNGAAGYKDCMEAAKVVENEHFDDQNEASKECMKDSPKEAEMVPESEIGSNESSLTDCKREMVSEERKIIRETEEKTKASYDIGNNTVGRESGEQCVSPVLPVEQKAALPRAPVSLVQPKDDQQNNEMQSEKIQGSNGSISVLKQENNGDVSVTEASCFDSKILMAETRVSVAKLAIEKPGKGLSQNTEKTGMAAAESDSQVKHANEQCTKVGMPAFASDDYQAEESVERFSTESNPNKPNAQAQMQKSPSFGLDLRIEARTEESDRTPLLYQDRTATEDFSREAEVNLGSANAQTQGGENKLQYHTLPMEEKVLRMEKNDSEKSKTPFLGFLKEEEEARIIVTTQKNDHNIPCAKKANKESLNLQAKEVASTSPKSKEKRKHRSSLFTNCVCCTTVIN